MGCAALPKPGTVQKVAVFTDAAGRFTHRNTQRNKHWNTTDLFNISQRVGKTRQPLVPDVVELSQVGHPSSIERVSHLPRDNTVTDDAAFHKTFRLRSD